MHINHRETIALCVLAVILSYGSLFQACHAAESLPELRARLARETLAAYKACPFSVFGSDYFSRYARDPDSQPGKGELMIGESCIIEVPKKASSVTRRMSEHLREFLSERMNIKASVLPEDSTSKDQWRIVLREEGGGDSDCPESFSISVADHLVRVSGRDPNGLRDGIVKLVDMMGLRLAPILPVGKKTYRPRLRIRLGAVPKLGSFKDLVFMGYNAVISNRVNLHALSTSSIIPELKSRQVPAVAEQTALAVQAASEYGLRSYVFLDTRKKFTKDDPVFTAHPEIRGALTWKADGEYVLCTEHPLVKEYLRDSIERLFKRSPSLDGIVVIIGGEIFYHCFMRPYGVEKGHTNCKRCEPLGSDRAVANLCNFMAAAARSIQPEAEVVAWPYSAQHVWSKDTAQEGFIRLLEPGTAIFTEIEKDAVMNKPMGVRKRIWDYSIDLIGPNDRAKAQIAACRATGIPIYMKSEPELAFEAPRLPHIPCMDRWAERAEALVSCGADGAWVFPAFRLCYGTSACDVNKLFWWNPHADAKTSLLALATRVAGHKAAPHMHKAWKHISEAIDWSPEMPSYYTGPYYLGPAHPMCADPSAKLPAVFYGRYLFHSEMTDAEGLKVEPTFVTSPTGNVPVFHKYYENMAECLKQAIEELEKARKLVPQRHALTFEAECSPIHWFYHTARTEANFYASCQIRDRLLALRDKDNISRKEKHDAEKLYQNWLAILKNEQDNTRAALPLIERDMRLDFYYGSDHTFPHVADMIEAKLAILKTETEIFLPSVRNAIIPVWENHSAQ